MDVSIQSGRHVQVVLKDPVQGYTNFTGRFQRDTERGIVILVSEEVTGSKFIPWENVGFINVMRERE